MRLSRSVFFGLWNENFTPQSKKIRGGCGPCSRTRAPCFASAFWVNTQFCSRCSVRQIEAVARGLVYHFNALASACALRYSVGIGKPLTGSAQFFSGAWLEARERQVRRTERNLQIKAATLSQLILVGLLVLLTPTKSRWIPISLRHTGAWAPTPSIQASKSNLRCRSPVVVLPAGASNLLARFVDRFSSRCFSPIQFVVRHARPRAPHRFIRRSFVPRHHAPVAPPICPDDFGAALYVSPPP